MFANLPNLYDPELQTLMDQARHKRQLVMDAMLKLRRGEITAKEAKKVVRDLGACTRALNRALKTLKASASR